MKVVFIPDTDDKYTPLVLTPNKAYDVIKVIDEIFYNFSFNRGFNSVNEVDKIYTNTLLTDNSAPQVIGIKNNELVLYKIKRVF